MPYPQVSVSPPPELLDTGGSDSGNPLLVYDHWQWGDPSDDSDGTVGSSPAFVPPSPRSSQHPATSLSASSLDTPESQKDLVPPIPSTGATSHSSYQGNECIVVPPASQLPSSFEDDYVRVNQDHPTSYPADSRPHHRADASPPLRSPPSCEVDSEDTLGEAPIDSAPNTVNPSMLIPGTASVTNSASPLPPLSLCPPLPRAETRPTGCCPRSALSVKLTPHSPPHVRASPRAYLSCIAKSQCAYPCLLCLAEDIAQARTRMSRTLKAVAYAIHRGTCTFSDRAQARARPSCFPPSRSGRSHRYPSRVPYDEHDRYMFGWLPTWCSSPDQASELEWSGRDRKSSEPFRWTESPEPMRLRELPDVDGNADDRGAAALDGRWRKTAWHSVFRQMLHTYS